MNDTAIQDVRARFLAILPDFNDFENPPQVLIDNELDYKRAAAKKARSILEEFVDNRAKLSTDGEARKVLFEVIELTNFLSWRDRVYLDGQLFSEDGMWIEFGNMLFDCLRETPDGNWQEALQKILDWLVSKNSWFSVTKILPTYFLFLWDPTRHFCVKSRFTDRFLKLLGVKPLGQGKPLTVDGYQRVLQTCDDLRSAIPDWKLRDNIDVHSLAWLVAGGWSDVSRPDRPTDTDPKPDGEEKPPVVQELHRPKIPLNLILAAL